MTPKTTETTPTPTPLATVRLTTGWATFGQCFTPGAVKGPVQVGNLPTQTDVKGTWPDGSTKFAVLTADATRAEAGDYPVTQGKAPAGTFEPKVPAVAVRFSTGVNFQPLGTFTPAGNTLKVTLSNQADGYVIADAVRVEPAADPSKAVTVNDGDPGFSVSGADKDGKALWTKGLDAADFGGDEHYAAAGTGSAVATWTFPGLTPGGYKVSASWSPGPNRATNAPYTVDDGTKTLGTAVVNQKVAPAGLTVPVATRTATLPAAPTPDARLGGPLVRKWRAEADPGLSPGLRVRFDVWCYADKTGLVRVTAANDLDAAGATAVTAAVEVLIDGKTVYSHDPLAQGYLTRWTRVVTFGGFAASAVTPDLEPVFASNALPRYLDAVTQAGTGAAQGATFDPLGSGALSVYMGMVGNRPEIAPYPDWAARYLVSKDPGQKALVLLQGDLAGSWPVHVREADGSFVSLDKRPEFWLDPRGTDKPKGSLNATGPLVPENSHTPSQAFIPYLLTGDDYYADEMADWANYHLLSALPQSRQNGRGLLVGAGQVRAMAWDTRDLADAAAYLPDADPRKAYLAAKLGNNLAWFDEYAATGMPANGLAFLAPGTASVPADKMFSMQWQNRFLVWAIDHANGLGFPGGEKLKDKLIDFEMGVLNDPVYRPYVGAYYTVGGLVKADGSQTVFPTQRELLAYNYGTPGTGMNPFVQPLVGYYSYDIRAMLLIAVRLGRPGAQDALDWLMAQPGVAADILSRPGWALAPAAGTVPVPAPAPPTTPEPVPIPPAPIPAPAPPTPTPGPAPAAVAAPLSDADVARIAAAVVKALDVYLKRQ